MDQVASGDTSSSATLTIVVGVAPLSAAGALPVEPAETRATAMPKGQSRPVSSVSHVQERCQWPPAAYSMKTPTPCPAGAVNVCPVSTTASKGWPLVAPEAPELLKPLLEPPSS